MTLAVYRRADHEVNFMIDAVWRGFRHGQQWRSASSERN
jgi:hypothetical protein